MALAQHYQVTREGKRMTNSNYETPARISEEYPTNPVFGVVDDDKAADALVKKLSELPIKQESIDVLRNEEAAEQIEQYRVEHPVKARLDHVMTFMSNESELIDQYNQRLNDGELIVSAEVADEAQAHEVADVMRQHGGHYINYFGTQVITTLEP
jgi:hypothetical protein